MRCGPKNAGDIAAVNPSGIKTLVANCLNVFFINGKPVFNNDPISRPINPPDCLFHMSF